jgi:GT2 family glycosyltransferase
MTAAAEPPAGISGLRATVIIPHLNTPDLLARCLASVFDQRLDAGDFEVIVVDNGSSPRFADSLAAVRQHFPQARWLAEPMPGPGLARNRGIAVAGAGVLAFIDADCRAAPGWLQAAVTAVAADPARAVVGGDIRIDFVDSRHLTGIEAYEAVFGFRQQMYIETKQFSVTANLAMARPVAAAVGTFGDIRIAEDLDWGRRAHAAGYPTRHLPAMLVYHPARPDFAALTRKWQRHIRHDWQEHRDAGRPGWAWRLRAAAMIVSVPVEAIKLFRSRRLAGIGNRLRGCAILARIRAFRAAEMLRVMAGADDAASVWNRQP